MTIIRGATTIPKDSAEEIQKAVKELLEQIESRNDLKRDEMVSLVFSSTGDIHSYYPAAAAREAGFARSGSLFSAQEPDIEGGLKLCIRVMIFVERNFVPHHVYLRGARNLRKDLRQVKIAIDGPSGSGKSTLARALAKELNIAYLDTGAMYRACGLKVLEAGVDIGNETAVYDLLLGVKLDICYRAGEQHTLLDGVDVSDSIRGPEVALAASAVSAYRSVRYHLTEKQREIAGRMSCVLDGRDIGTFVLPEADVKIFLTARPEVRAKRRYEELRQKGFDVNLDEILREIMRRDEQDSTRSAAPLKKADDALEIDTSDLTAEETLLRILGLVREKLA